MPETVCVACANSQVRHVSVRSFTLRECQACGLRQLLDPPLETELAILYETGFYGGPGRGALLVHILHRINNAIRMREVDGLPAGRLLDVGSGKGRFLAAARRAGWDVVGIEYAKGAAEAARRQFDLNIVAGDFMTTPIDGVFDVVTMWHTLEHLPDPGGAVDRAARVLKPGGRLIVSVPNAASLQARWGGDDWFHLDLPRHLFHFNERSLVSLLERHGFTIVRTGHFYPEMEVIGLIQTALNRAGLGRDTLYRFAKHDETGDRGMRLGLSVALAMALAPAATVWSVIAPALKTGASIQVTATRSLEVNPDAQRP
jgi:SAM-dependent methyltransferase